MSYICMMIYILLYATHFYCESSFSDTANLDNFQSLWIVVRQKKFFSVKKEKVKETLPFSSRMEAAWLPKKEEKESQIKMQWKQYSFTTVNK